MNYENTLIGNFISRPNRFIAKVTADGAEQTVHVKNTGRCKELLLPNAKVVLQKSDNPNRKTLYDLIAVYKGDTLINMDSQSPNKAVYEWLKNGGYISSPTRIKPEAKYGSSRLDFYIENATEKCFAEVKGVTLELNHTAVFPDAPTERGRKHITELIQAKNEGYKTAIIFVVQMKGCTKFMPNYETDMSFAKELKRAYNCGVEIIAVDCNVTESSMVIDKEIEVCL